LNLIVLFEIISLNILLPSTSPSHVLLYQSQLMDPFLLIY
jgi:hypothetical protein